MPSNPFLEKHKDERDVTMQQLIDVGINPSALRLLIESYTNRPEKEMTPVDFNMFGVHIRIETTEFFEVGGEWAMENR